MDATLRPDQHPRVTAPASEGHGLSRARAALILAALILAAAWKRAAGLNPGSLWLDDLWLTCALQRLGPGDLFAAGLPSPPGFFLLAQAALRLRVLGLPLELALQLPAFLVSLAVIPAFYIAARPLLGRREPALLGAAILAWCPALGACAVRVKHYPFDALAVILVMAAGHRLLRRPSPGRAGLLVLTALACGAFSFAALMVAAAIAAAALIWLLRQRPRPIGAAAALALLFPALAALYFGYLKDCSSPAMKAFWAGHFWGFDDPAAAFDFAAGPLRRAFSRPFRKGLEALLLAWPLGLWAWRGKRELWVLAAPPYAAALLACALRLYPLGEARLDLFLAPVTLLVWGAGLELGAAHLRRQGRGRLAASGYAVIGAAALIALPLSRPVGYPESRAREAARAIARAGAEDAILVYPLSAYGLAVYSERRFRLTATRTYAHNFELASDELVILEAAATIAPALDRDPAFLKTLDRALAGRPPRLFVVGADGRADPLDQGLGRALAARGYRLRPRPPGWHRALVTVFERGS